MNFEQLPESILLEIMTYLNVKDRLSAAGVCQKWRRVSGDKSLWKHVDLSSYKLTVQQLSSFVRTHFDGALASLRLKGYLDPDVVSSWKKNSLSDVVLRDLYERCPNLRDLSITHTNFTKISINAMPKNVEAFAIQHSSIPSQWFRPLIADKQVMPNLSILDLSFCGKTTDFTLECIAKARTGITSLRLNGCYLVTGEGIIAVAENLKQLIILEVSETKCDDLAVHHICRGLSKLRELDLARCMGISDGSLAIISSTLKELQSVKFRGCAQLTERGFLGLLNASDSLLEVDVAGTCINAQIIDRLEQSLPHCVFIM